MAEIVTIDASDVGTILSALWASRGGRHVSSERADLADAQVVLFGGSVGSIDALSDLLAGKLLIDCGRELETEDGASLSRTQRIARALPRTPVVKAFCNPSTDVLRFVVKHGGPEIGTVYVSGLYCGDDPTAKTIVAGLIGETNLDPVDCGGLSRSKLLDAVAALERHLDARYAMTSIGVKRDGSPADSFF